MIGSKFRRCVRLIGINVAVLLIGVTGIELVEGNWFVSYVLPKPNMASRTFTFQQTLYQPPSMVTFSRDQYGLRGVRQPISSVNLVTIGGSTTTQTFITDGDTWQDVIHAQTGLVVANAGIDGMGSQSVREVLEDWIDRVPGLRAKYFLHYIGVNEAGMAQTVTAANRPKRYSWSRHIRGRSAILQGIARLKEWMSGPGVNLVSHQGIAVPPAGTPMRSVQAERAGILNYMEKMYKPNLRDILDLHRQRGETAIFVTQTANPALISRRERNWFVSRSELDVWAAALDEANKATEAVCNERPDTCRLIDLAARIEFIPSDFYDLVHNTPQGARKVGSFLAAELAVILGPNIVVNSNGRIH